MSFFAAIPVPVDIGAQLQPLQTGVSAAKWHPQAKLHITLAFFGKIDNPALVERLADGLATLPSPALDIQLTKPGWLGGLEPNALVLDVEKTNALEALAAGCVIVAQRVGAPVELRNFEPHLTLAYIDDKLSGTGMGEVMGWQAAHYPVQPLPAWRADQFGLYQSGIKQPDGGYLLRCRYALGALRR